MKPKVKPVFKDKQHAEREYAREYLRIVEMQSHKNPFCCGQELRRPTPLDTFFVENVEKIVIVPCWYNPEKTDWEFRGQHDAVIASFTQRIAGYNEQMIADIWGDNPPPPLYQNVIFIQSSRPIF